MRVGELSSFSNPSRSGKERVAVSEPQGGYPNEQGRWMLVFGIPMLVACIFMAMTLGTSIRWLLAFCLAFGPGVGVVSLVYLALSSDTNDGK
jgi:hypothetical protein